MKASYYIRLTRNSTAWSNNTYLITIVDANFPASCSKNTNPSRDSPSSNTASQSSQPIGNQGKCDERTNYPGFFNMGNTCYVN